MTLSDDDRAELLLDHYNDTNAVTTRHWRERNRLFMYALLVTALIAVSSFSPQSLSDLVNGWLEKTFLSEGAEWKRLEFDAIDLAARFLLLCLVIQYYQRSILVDRQYRYLHRLEERLCELTGTNDFTREGQAYFSRKGTPDEGAKAAPAGASPDDRPWFLRGVGPLYVYVFPLLLSALVIWRSIAQDLGARHWAVAYLGVLCSVAIVGYSVFYVIWVRWRR